MKTSTNETILQETEPILQLKKSLLPIDEYATRKGMSIDIVEECAKLGIIQIRKYKGRTFVVDVPHSQYTYDSETIDEPTQHIDEPTQHIDEPTQTKEKPESAEITQNTVYHLGILTEQAGAKRTWQIAALFSLALLFAAFFANLWFYMDRNIQSDRLDQAYISVQKLYDDFTQASQNVETTRNQLNSYTTEVAYLQNEMDKSTAQVGTLQNEMDKSTAQVGTLRNELDKSTAQVRTLQNELAAAGQNLEIIQQRNTEEVNRLKEQIRNLTARITEPAKNPRTPSGSATSGR